MRRPLPPTERADPVTISARMRWLRERRGWSDAARPVSGDLRGIFEVVQHLGSGQITQARLPFDCVQDDLFEVRVEVGLKMGRRLRILAWSWRAASL